MISSYDAIWCHWARMIKYYKNTLGVQNYLGANMKCAPCKILDNDMLRMTETHYQEKRRDDYFTYQKSCTI